jgi:hypothetical protein
MKLVLGFALLGLGFAQGATADAPVTQPPEERARQQLMPQSTDPLWMTLAHSRITTDLKRGVFLADHPADVRALDGKEVTLQGFMLATTINGPIPYFILTRYTPVCAFCPPGAPNEAVEVTLVRFVKRSTSGLVTVKGRFHVSSDAAAGLFFSLDGAVVTSES